MDQSARTLSKPSSSLLQKRQEPSHVSSRFPACDSTDAAMSNATGRQRQREVSRRPRIKSISDLHTSHPSQHTIKISHLTSLHIALLLPPLS